MKLLLKPLELPVSQKHYTAAIIEPSATAALECCHNSLKVHSHHLILLLPQKSNVLEALPPFHRSLTLVIKRLILSCMAGGPPCDSCEIVQEEVRWTTASLSSSATLPSRHPFPSQHTETYYRAGIFKQSMGARHRAGIGFRTGPPGYIGRRN